jgi:hypothetical protein
MAEVLLSTDELTVLGGPAEISVDVDFGPEGERGSLTFVGNGKPDSFTLPSSVEELKVFDIYINVSASDDEYQYLYQYLPTEGGSANWTKVIKLSPISYSHNEIITFNSSGVGTTNINLNAFLPIELLATYAASDFNIQANILDSNPISFGLGVGEIVSGSSLVLPLTINAIRYSSGSWEPLTGAQTVHILITIKNNIA